MKFGFEVFEAEIGARGQPFVFDFAPEDFDEVELGAVGWQPVQADTLAKPVHDARLKSPAGVNGGVVEDDEAECPGAGGLGGEGGGRGDAPDDGLKLALIRGAEESQHVRARARSALEGQGLSPRLPGIRHRRREIETALVEIEQLDHPSYMALVELA